MFRGQTLRPFSGRAQNRVSCVCVSSWLTHNVRNTGCYCNILLIRIKVKWCRYRPGVAQRVGRGIALLFHHRGTRKGWVVSSTSRPHFTPGKDPVPILQEAGWAPGPVCTGGKSRPHRDSMPDRPARSQSLYRLSYPAQNTLLILNINHKNIITFYPDVLSKN